MDLWLGMIVGLVLGCLGVWLVMRARTAADAERVARLTAEVESARREASSREELLAVTEVRLRDTFTALASDALRSSHESFLQLARPELEQLFTKSQGDLKERQQAVENLVKPIGESLSKVGEEILRLDKERAASHADLSRLMNTVNEDQRALKTETANLVRALRRPEVRGRWGELQLRKVVEMAGMVDHVDFTEQTTVEGEAGKLRPDMVVRLPGGQTVVVDAKAPLDAYLAAVEAETDERRAELLTEHARHIRDHMRKLGAKSYWNEFTTSPEFVVMFLPGENIFGEALSHDPSLIEKGVDEKVIPASPTTLIALLRAVAYGWNQQVLADSAREVSALGRELYVRLRTMTGHIEKLGQNLGRAVDSYNATLGSFERKVLPQVRRFEELGAASGELIETPSPVEKQPRAAQAPEFLAFPPDGTVD